MPSVSAGTQIIPASLKERQWKDFSCLIDRLAKRRPAGTELRLLHYVFSSGANMGILTSQKRDLEGMMHYVDMPAHMFCEFAPMLECSGALKVIAISALMEEHAQGLGVAVRFAPSVRGALRAYGTRRSGGNGWHTFFAPNTPVVFGVDSGEENADIVNKDAYYPPSTSLLSLWRSMCAGYDSLRQSASGFDEALLAESFLQLMGTRALHPFMDGNGRTFCAHLALSLHRWGLPLADFPHAHALMKSLSPIHDEFVSALLRDAGLGFVSNSGHIRMALDCGFREDYLRRLTFALETAIDCGTSPRGPYHPHLLALKEEIERNLPTHL